MFWFFMFQEKKNSSELYLTLGVTAAGKKRLPASLFNYVERGCPFLLQWRESKKKGGGQRREEEGETKAGGRGGKVAAICPKKSSGR